MQAQGEIATGSDMWETGDTIALIGLVLTWFASMIGFTVGLAKWAGARIDTLRRDTDEKIGAAHERMNGLAAQLVPRTEVLQHLGKIESGLDRMNGRMDTIINNLAANALHKDGGP